MTKSSLLFLLLRPINLMTIFYNPNIDKHDTIKNFCIISRCIKEKHATFNVKISEMFHWAAGGNIRYLVLENVRSQVAVAMKYGNDDDLKSVRPIANSGSLLLSPTPMPQPFFH